MLTAVVAALLAVLVAGMPMSAVAGGKRGMTGDVGSPRHRNAHAGDRVGHRAPLISGFSQFNVSRPSQFSPDVHARPGARHAPDRRFHRPRNVVIVSSPVIVVSPPARCWNPGYWTYQWTPQATTTHAWVPGYWATNGAWIDGQWHPQTVTTGYWQPVWVPDEWIC
ncbi:MAG: hypothetical protein HYU51_19050 [Candidatus Rokubacteria bacterium]|nr:hypothetical protein [Candidatus Rokubacteria bacterium]